MFTLNSVPAKHCAQRAARACESGHATRPLRRKKKIDEAIGGRGNILIVAEPPGLRGARQQIYVHVLYLNHLEQAKARVRASPAARTAATVRSFADTVIAGDIIDHYRAG